MTIPMWVVYTLGGAIAGVALLVVIAFAWLGWKFASAWRCDKW